MFRKSITRTILAGLAFGFCLLATPTLVPEALFGQLAATVEAQNRGEATAIRTCRRPKENRRCVTANTFDAASFGSGMAADGAVLTADGSGGSAFEVVESLPSPVSVTSTLGLTDFATTDDSLQWSWGSGPYSFVIAYDGGSGLRDEPNHRTHRRVSLEDIRHPRTPLQQLHQRFHQERPGGTSGRPWSARSQQQRGRRADSIGSQWGR